MATYLITQATGQQSQWIITHLLAAGAKVNAVVRDLEKAPPALKKEGITLFKGESVNLDEIVQAAKGCKGAFLNTFPYPGLEAQQARTIVEACKKTGIETVVTSTTFTTNKKTLWDDDVTKEIGLHQYFQSKAEVEEIVRTGNFKAYTILRPAVLHTDFMLPGVYGNFPGLPRGELDHACNDGVNMIYTDTHDVGKYAAAALLDPAKFGGQEIDMSNEHFTVEETRDILVKVSGRDVRVRKLSTEEIEKAKATVFGMLFQLLLNSRDYSAYKQTAKDVQDKFGIPFTPLEKALQRDQARLLECLPA